MKNKIILLVLFLLCLKVSAQCTGCTVTNPPNGNYTFAANSVVCFTANRTFSDVVFQNNSTICIAPGVTVIIQNNVNSSNGHTVYMDISGTLQFNQSPQINANLQISIPSGGVLKAGSSGNNNFTFNGSGANRLTNYGNVQVSVLGFNQNSATNIVDNYNTFTIGNNINIQGTTTFRNIGTLNIGASYNNNSTSTYINCGTINSAVGYNLGGGRVINTGIFNVGSGSIDMGGNGIIENYGTLTSLGTVNMNSNATFYTEGLSKLTTLQPNGATLKGPASSSKKGYFYVINKINTNGTRVGPNLDFKRYNSYNPDVISGSQGESQSFTSPPIYKDASNNTVTQAVANVTYGCTSCTAPVFTNIDSCPNEDGTFPPVANDDSYNMSAGTNSPTSVLINDLEEFNGNQATTSNVIISQISTSNPGVTINTSTGFVQVAGGTAPGIYTLVYQICRTSLPTSCDTATVTVNLLQPFPSCPTTMYLTQYPANGGTRLYTLNNVTNPLTITQIGNLAPFPVQINAIGFNPIDSFIYGINQGDSHLYQMDANFNYADLGAVSGLPSADYISGDIDDLGNFYVKANSGANGGAKLYKLNIITKTATLITLSQQVKPADLAYNKVDGLLYGVHFNSEKLFTINPANGNVSIKPQANGNGAAFGAIYTDGLTGAVYGNENDSSAFYKFNLTTGKSTKVSNSISAVGNDGAHCVNAPIVFGVDLIVNKTDGKTEYIPGTTNVYTVTVTNNGPFTALDAVIYDAVPTGVDPLTVTWTASATIGSDIGNTSGTGTINETVNIQNGGIITFTITLPVPSNYSGDLVNTATATVSANNVDTDPANNSSTDTDKYTPCYDDPLTSTGVATIHGITLLKRAGAGNGNWPMIRTSAHIVLESNNKGFVITRMTSEPSQSGAANYITKIVNPQDGMMVYDTFAKCLKIYTIDSVVPANTGWKCYSTATCL